MLCIIREVVDWINVSPYKMRIYIYKIKKHTSDQQTLSELFIQWNMNEMKDMNEMKT